MMKGGFIDKYWMVLSIGGVIFLGIGDTAVSTFELYII